MTLQASDSLSAAPSSTADLITAWADLLGVLLWPVVVIVLALVFKANLSRFARFIDTIEFKGLKAQLRREIDKASATTEQLRAVSASVTRVAASLLAHQPIGGGMSIGERLQRANELRDHLVALGAPEIEADAAVLKVRRVVRAILLEDTRDALFKSAIGQIEAASGKRAVHDDPDVVTLRELVGHIRPSLASGKGIDTTVKELEDLFVQGGFPPTAEGRAALERLREFDRTGRLSEPLAFDERDLHWAALADEAPPTSATSGPPSN